MTSAQRKAIMPSGVERFGSFYTVQRIVIGREKGTNRV
jgi:hypothetical protein